MPEHLPDQRQRYLPGSEQFEQPRAPLAQIQPAMHRGPRGRATNTQGGTDLGDQLIPIVDEPTR